ncbi:MAG: hypothetical protein A3J99_07150 [Sideroxydans sp. RIFOXYD2_FULL_59_7]|nr:MAG: hypothetical protein A3J99_07150 [Sideroxydans sp. RIFOXYD2_FULL_59_7]
MNIKPVIPLLLALACAPAQAEGGKITITSPVNGALVAANIQVQLNYEATLGASGDHLHLFLDDDRIDILRQLKGSAEVDVMKPGKHKICLTENTKWHMSTGLESCVEVTAQ